MRVFLLLRYFDVTCVAGDLLQNQLSKCHMCFGCLKFASSEHCVNMYFFYMHKYISNIVNNGQIIV